MLLAVENSHTENLETSIHEPQPVGETHATVGQSVEHAAEPAADAHAIVLAPEALFNIGPLPVTNTLMVSWIVMAFLIVLAIMTTRKVQKIPTGLQNFFEMVLDSGYTLTKDLAHNKAKVFFPIIMTFFLFIVTANWFGLFPGFGTVYLEKDGHQVHLLRSINSDLNMTLGLALTSAALTHYFAVKYLGVGGYLKKWFSLNPILLFVGILEIISEFTKVFSLSFRLFGNIFAGEEVLKTVSGIAAFIAPLPFFLLEIIVGFVQAAVFMMLTLVFMVLLAEKHETH